MVENESTASGVIAARRKAEERMGGGRGRERERERAPQREAREEWGEAPWGHLPHAT